MDNFNLTSFFRDQYLKEVEKSEPTSLSKKVLDVVEEETPVKEFAVAVAEVLKEGYGSRNFSSFMEVLHKELGMNESLSEQQLNESPEKLEAELESMFKEYNPTITVGEYAGGRPDSDPLKGMGFAKIAFRKDEYFDKDEWEKMVGMIDGKEFENIKANNTSEFSDPGDRATIRFDYKLGE